MNYDFIKSYESYLSNQNKSITTIGIYLRHIKSICNYAILKGIMKQEEYPFRNYTIPSGRKNKRSLSSSDIKSIIGFQTDIIPERKARDFWVLSYLCNGINFNDIARLKYSNMTSDQIKFVRTKTENKTRGDIKEIIIHILPPVLKIISEWKNNEISEDNYIFPILREGLSEKEEIKTIAQFIQTTNKYLKRISEKLNFDIPLTTYFARHCFATQLKRGGVSIEYISESLGHSTTKVTQNYLGSFTDDTVRKNAELLLDL